MEKRARNIYAIVMIPAKGTSTRLPGKNKQKILNRSLVEHAIDYAKSSSYIHEIYVITDDPEIAVMAKKNDAIPVDLPKELGGDNEVADVYIEILKHTGIDKPEITHVVGLQPDHPDRQIRLNDILEYAVDKNYMDVFTVSSAGVRNGSVRVIEAKYMREGKMSRRVGAVLDACTNVEYDWKLEQARHKMENGDWYTVRPQNIPQTK